MEKSRVGACEQLGELPPAGLGGRSVLVAGTRLPPPAPSEEPVTQPGCLGPAAAHCADKETKTSAEGILSRILLIRYGCISCHNVLPSRPSKIPHTVVSNCLLLPFVANVQPMPTLVSPPPPLLTWLVLSPVASSGSAAPTVGKIYSWTWTDLGTTRHLASLGGKSLRFNTSAHADTIMFSC